MANKRSIFEIRYRPLLSVILTTIVLLSAYTIALGFAPLELSSMPSSLGAGIDAFELSSPVWSHVFIWTGVLYISIGLAQNASRFNIYGTPTPLPMELYVLLLMIFGGLSLRMLIVSLLIYTSLRRFYSSYRAANSAGILCSAAVYLGVVPLLSPPTIILWLCVVPVMILFDRSIHEMIVTFVSLLIPLFSYLYIIWFMGGSFAGEFFAFVDTITAGEGLLAYASTEILDSPTLLVRIGCVVVPILLYILSLFVLSNVDNTVRAKRRVMVTAIYGGAALAMVALPSFNLLVLPLVALPLSLIIPVFLIKSGRAISFIIYAVIIVAAIFSVIYGAI